MRPSRPSTPPPSPGLRVEAGVDGFVVDVAGPDELVEIQTASFGSASRKLERLLASHRVVLVHPVPLEKWIVRVDAEGRVLGRRRSPRRGQPIDLFDELVHIPALIAHADFRVELLLTREEEVRGPDPRGRAVPPPTRLVAPRPPPPRGRGDEAHRHARSTSWACSRQTCPSHSPRPTSWPPADARSASRCASSTRWSDAARSSASGAAAGSSPTGVPGRLQRRCTSGRREVDATG